jgi:hypothetical protein
MKLTDKFETSCDCFVVEGKNETVIYEVRSTIIPK